MMIMLPPQDGHIMQKAREAAFHPLQSLANPLESGLLPRGKISRPEKQC
jgi:hypothetical protein